MKPDPKGGNPLSTGFAFGGGMIRALDCGAQGGEAGLCLGVAPDGVSLVLVSCGDASANGWQQHNASSMIT